MGEPTKALARYTLVHTDIDGSYMDEDPAGNWVKFDAIAAAKAAPQDEPCHDGCQYSKDVGMWPEHSCANGCVYEQSAPAPSIAAAWPVVVDWLNAFEAEERDFSRYADHVSLDGIMTAAQRRAVSAALAAAPQAAPAPVATLKRRIDYRLNEHLCEMKPEYDDSILGFNEAWDIVNAVFAAPPAVTEAAPDEPSEAIRQAARDAFRVTPGQWEHALDAALEAAFKAARSAR